MVRSYDVLINNEPYLYGPRGGVRLGDALKEPGATGQVGSIVITSLHHGAGQKVARDSMKYDTGTADATVMGMLLPAGAQATTGSVTASDSNPRRDGAFQWGDDVYFTMGDKVLKVDTNDNLTVAYTLPSSPAQQFTGSVTYWRNKVLLGVETSTLYTLAVVEFDGANFNYNDALHLRHSFAVSTRSALFWVTNSGSVPSLRWTDKTDVDFLSLTTNDVYGPFYLESGGWCTGMARAGPFAVTFKKDGSIQGFDPSEVYSPLTPERGYIRDDTFGSGSQQMLSFLLVPTNNEVLRFDPRTLELGDITPAKWQQSSPPVIPGTPGMPVVVSSGSEAYVFHDFADQGRSLLRLVAYPDGMYYHTVKTGMSYKVKAMHIRHDTNTGKRHLYLLEHTGASARVTRIEIPYQGWLGSINVSAASLTTSLYFGEPPGITKVPIQVRGWASASASYPIGVDIAVDSGTWVSLGNVTSEGPFALAVPQTLLGRGIKLRFTINASGTNVSRLEFPVSIDYVYISSVTDMVTITVTVTSDTITRLGGRWSRNYARKQVDDLRALRGQATTIEFADSTQPAWNVFVQEVRVAQAIPGEGDPTPGYQVDIACRRL